jgi:hypothetical protein
MLNATEATTAMLRRIVLVIAPMYRRAICYEFTAVKHEGVWRFSRWVLRVDQANV